MEGSRLESLDQRAPGVWGQSLQLPEAEPPASGGYGGLVRSPQPLKKICNFEVKIAVFVYFLIDF